MSEYTIETRRRSRSKTPFLRSTCDHELCEHAGDEEHVHHAHHHQHNHPHHKKKAAAQSVQTIVEEVIEVTSSSSSPHKQQPPTPVKQYESKQVERIKTKTSDYSSEDTSPENKQKRTLTPAFGKTNSGAGAATTTTSTITTSIVTKSKRLNSALGGGGGGGGAATSTPKGNTQLTESFAEQFAGDVVSGGGGRRYTEITQNTLNTRRELETSQQQRDHRDRDHHNNSSASQRSNRSKRSSTNSSLSRIFGESFDMATADLSNHLPYIEYKETGEYWNKTPKTDYTYSELSPHRRLLAPGVVAMPNMSRHSLENYGSRAHFMQNYEQDQCVRRHFYETTTTTTSNKYAANRRETEKLMYDSGDELDYNRFANYRKNNRHYNGGNYAQHTEQNRNWLMRIITTIVTTITTTLTGGGSNDAGVTDIGAAAGGAGVYAASSSSSATHIRRKTSQVYATPGMAVQRGFFGTIGHGISSTVASIGRYIGVGISSVLAADTWLLQTRNADNKWRKRFLLILLLLLPLLLLAAAWYFLPADERLAYVQRAQALVPLSLLASMRNAGTALHGALHWPIEWADRAYAWTTTAYAPSPPAHTTTHVHIEQLQRALTAAEYEQLLQHVNGYVQQMVDAKLQQQQQRITPEQMQVIVRVMRENLEQYAREQRDTQPTQFAVNLDALSEADVQRLAARVQQQLVVATRDWQTASSGGGAVRLTADQLAEIRRLIVEHETTTHNHAYYTLLTQQLDVDALLARVLAAPQLAEYIDARIGHAVDVKVAGLKLQVEGSGSGGGAGARLLNELSSEVAFIKLALSDKQSENANLQQSIVQLEGSQAHLLERLRTHELATDQRFSALLGDIERKLASLKDDNFAALNQQIRLSLIDILGFKQTTASGAQLQDADLQQWLANMFVAKDYLEQRLMALNNRTNDKIREEIDRSAVVLMRDINERLKREILLVVEARQRENAAQLKGHISAALSEEEVRRIVKSVLAIYDADKTGLVDFALESAGGQILSTRCTESYQTKTAQLSVFGIPLWYPTNTPRVAISPNVQPGECWAFQGFPGFLVLKLNSLVYVTGFTLEHIPRSLSPNGRIESAPGNFTVWGLEHEKDYEPTLFGEYEYADNNAALQYFPVQNENIKRPYDIVELRIESNHGHPQYTCLYRFRVHGKPPAA